MNRGCDCFPYRIEGQKGRRRVLKGSPEMRCELEEWREGEERENERFQVKERRICDGEMVA